ncbi:MAG: hypothetical protein QXH13_02895 [Thermoplasmata archaeon]
MSFDGKTHTAWVTDLKLSTLYQFTVKSVTTSGEPITMTGSGTTKNVDNTPHSEHP